MYLDANYFGIVTAGAQIPLEQVFLQVVDRGDLDGFSVEPLDVGSRGSSFSWMIASSVASVLEYRWDVVKCLGIASLGLSKK